MSITKKNGLKISSILFDFINNEVVPETAINSDEFWIKFAKIVHEWDKLFRLVYVHFYNQLYYNHKHLHELLLPFL